MKVTLKNYEIEAVAKVLRDGMAVKEDGSPAVYESIEEMAAAMLKIAAEVISMRDSYALVLRWDNLDGRAEGQNFGPYGSILEAQKASDRLAGAGAVRRIVTLNSTGMLQGRFEGTVWRGMCKCGHMKEEHFMAGNGYGGCGVAGCSPKCNKLDLYCGCGGTCAACKKLAAAKRKKK